MGYRSEVAYGVKVDDIEYVNTVPESERTLSADGLFLLMLTEMQQDPIAGKCFTDEIDINTYLTVNKEQRTIVFSEGHLKWYETYTDVQAHERLYKIMEEYAELYGDKEELNRNPISCAFIRIGEDMDDVEERGSGDDPWGIASVYRGIDIHI